MGASRVPGAGSSAGSSASGSGGADRDPHLGLAGDLRHGLAGLDRRGALRLLVGVGAASLAGFGCDDEASGGDGGAGAAGGEGGAGGQGGAGAAGGAGGEGGVGAAGGEGGVGGEGGAGAAGGAGGDGGAGGGGEGGGGEGGGGAGGAGGAGGEGGGLESCDTIPPETAGPFPGDGTIGGNVLTEAGVVRRDIRSSIGGANGVAEGVPLTVRLKIVAADGGCVAMPGHAVYIWHCDRDGDYSMYSAGVTDENYLRGVQATDAAGEVEFVTIFPGCYPGRWPHIHFEVFPSLDTATDGRAALATSQLAFPEADCAAAYAAPGYEASLRALAGVTLASDGVFRDGAALQLASMSGSAAEGFVATLLVAIEHH